MNHSNNQFLFKFKKNELVNLVKQDLNEFYDIDWSNIFKKIARRPVSPQMVKAWQQKNQKTGKSEPWETDPDTGERYIPTMNYAYTWAKTPPERRIPAMIGALGQQGFSKEAVQDYENYYKTLYKGAKSPLAGLIPKGIKKSAAGAATALVDPGLETQLPALMPAVTLDQRVLAFRT